MTQSNSDISAPSTYTCVGCGRTTGRFGRWWHTYLGWRWWSLRKDLRCR